MINTFISQTKTNMSHAEQVVTTTAAIITKTFSINLIPKAVTSFFTVLLWIVTEGNETIIGLIFLLYFIDLITGVAAAIFRRDFQSRKFFMGATKLLVYGAFAAIGVSLWQVLHLGNFFLAWIFAFIIITDSSSILENLEKLWYNTPIFLSKYLKVAQKNLEKKYMWITVSEITPNETKNENKTK